MCTPTTSICRLWFYQQGRTQSAHLQKFSACDQLRIILVNKDHRCRKLRRWKRSPFLREGFQKSFYKRVRMTMKICSLESPSVFCSDFGRRQNKQRARPKHTLPPWLRMSRTTTMCHNYRNAKIITWTNAKHIKWPWKSSLLRPNSRGEIDGKGILNLHPPT